MKLKKHKNYDHFPVFDAFIEKYNLTDEKKGNIVYLGSMLKWALRDLKEMDRFHKQIFSRTQIVREGKIDGEKFAYLVDLMPDPFRKEIFADGLASMKLLNTFFKIFNVMQKFNLIKSEYRSNIEEILEELIPWYTKGRFGSSDLEEMVKILAENLKIYVFLFQNGFIFPIYEIQDDLENLFSGDHKTPMVLKSNSDYG